MKKSTGKAVQRVRFQFAGEPGSEVYVVGTFNNWNGKANRLQDTPGTGAYAAMLSIPIGRHEYKFLVNGDWRTDPRCPETVRNAYGSLNSVIVV